MNSSKSWHTIQFAFKALQVRLRFIMLLVVAFVVVGQWNRIRSSWDSLLSAVRGQSSAQQSVSPDVEFFCPMDPGVINDWPSICPVCNMVLVRRKKGEMAVLPEGVVARMQFSPYRVQLAGIQTTPIKAKALVQEWTSSSELTSSDDQDPNMLRLKIEMPRRAAQVDLTKRVALVTSDDVPGIVPCPAHVESQAGTLVTLNVDNKDHWLEPGMWATARFEIPFQELAPFRSRPATAATVLTVPESAVVDYGSQRIVYVETHPGTFDGQAVTLGPRCGDEYPVISGLAAGQRVATAGAFLIDAEARLNPSAAASYFGAAGATPTTPASPSIPIPTPPVSADPIPTSASRKLSKADEKLVRHQKLCPVTGLSLDSMGGPVPVIVQGRKVFICCEGCEGKLKSNPKKYLAKLPGKQGTD